MIHIKRFETNKDTIVFIQIEIDGEFYDIGEHFNPVMVKQ